MGSASRFFLGEACDPWDLIQRSTDMVGGELALVGACGVEDGQLRELIESAGDAAGSLVEEFLCVFLEGILGHADVAPAVGEIGQGLFLGERSHGQGEAEA